MGSGNPAMGNGIFLYLCFHAQVCHRSARTRCFQPVKERGLILVSHQPSQMREHCNIFYVLHDGYLKHFDDVDQAYAYYSEQG